MRVIVRKERPHPGAQLRFDDVDGMRITAFVTNTRRGQLPDLELRHRRRARCEDRIRLAKDRADQPAPARLRAEPDLRTWEGWLYLATVIDAHSRRVIGWAIADHMRTDLVEDALKMAITLRGELPAKVVFHTDRGNTPRSRSPATRPRTASPDRWATQGSPY